MLFKVLVGMYLLLGIWGIDEMKFGIVEFVIEGCKKWLCELIGGGDVM